MKQPALQDRATLRAHARGPDSGLGDLELAITDADRGPISFNPASRPSIEYVDIVDGILGGTRADRSRLLTAAKALRFRQPTPYQRGSRHNPSYYIAGVAPDA